MTEVINPKQQTLTFLLASKNEEVSLAFVISELIEIERTLFQLVASVSLVIVDDSNWDIFELGRRQLSDQLKVAGSRIELTVLRGPNVGLSGALLHGFKFIQAGMSGSWIINLDADGQHDIRASVDLLRRAIITGSHCVIGSRWTQGGSAPGLGLGRRLVSRVATQMLHQVGVPRSIKDPTTSFRCYHPTTVKLISHEVRGFGGFAFFPASIALIAGIKMRITEVPITFRPRAAGTSKLNFSAVLSSVRELFRIWSLSRMARKRSRWFETSTTEQYVGSEELRALQDATKFQEYVATMSRSRLNGRCLEIGAGLGTSADALLRVGSGAADFSLALFEPDAVLKTFLSERFEGKSSEVSIIDDLGTVAPGTVENVFLYSVLEHVDDDQAFVSKITKLLSPGGVLVCLVPRMPSIFGTIDGSSGHFRRYDVKSIQSVLAGAGMKVESIRYVDSLGWIPYWLTYSVLQRTHISPLAVGLSEKVLLPLIRLADRLPLLPRLASKNILIHASTATEVEHS